MITFSAPAILRSMSGMASPRRPWRVRTHRDRLAPATRKRDVSLSPLRSFSSLRARKWSSPVSQSQGLPSAEQMPWPNCVILSAVQLNSGSAAISPATTLVLPTLRECPPITTIAIHLFSQVFGRLRTAILLRSRRLGCRTYGRLALLMRAARMPYNGLRDLLERALAHPLPYCDRCHGCAHHRAGRTAAWP